MASTSTKVGHFLAKVLGIELQDPDVRNTDEVTRGESVFSIQTTDTFVEQQPSTSEWLRELAPTKHEATAYLKSLFPVLSWIGHYNLKWLTGDLVAGITIGAVVVPQGMAYALLANLPPEYGLYSSFMGVMIYWLFATSKDITIGPVAVMSTIVGNVIIEVQDKFPDQYTGPTIACALSLITGCIIVFIGLIRCGWIVDLISLTSLSAFMTGSAINIAVGQLAGLMGIRGLNTREAPYIVFINTLKNLGGSHVDAAMGLTALTMLYAIRSGFTLAAKRYPRKQRLLFFLNTLRTAFVILLYTMISWLVNRHRRSNPMFKILGTVPRGLKHAGVPDINTSLLGALGPFLPAAVIVLLVEHIAISKSFGRINNYVINPSQEMVAIGVTNIFGPFLGGYPATGSFSRTAIKSKAGVRTPFAGVITGAVVILAIYTLTAVFFYIPNATLSAVIIHAVLDLITPPNTVYQFWRVSPLEVLIFSVGVLVSVFNTIENGIYSTVAISAAILLFRILKARGTFLGKVKVHSVLGDHVIGDDHHNVMGAYGTFSPTASSDAATRNVFLPISHSDGSNPEIEVQSPYPGIFIYRFTEGFNYPNASHTLDYLLNYIFAHTRRTNLVDYARPGDRPWNDPGPSRSKRAREAAAAAANERPTLNAVILDMSAVNNVDITSVQRLIDVRNQLDRYTTPNVVDWHFAYINNRWTKRALASAGFGFPTERSDGLRHRWRSIFSVAEIGGADSAAEQAEMEANEKELSRAGTRLRSGVLHDEEVAPVPAASPVDTPEPLSSTASSQDPDAKTATGFHVIEKPGVRAGKQRRGVVVHGINRPLFHVDLTSALQSAIANVEARSEIEPSPTP